MDQQTSWLVSAIAYTALVAVAISLSWWGSWKANRQVTREMGPSPEVEAHFRTARNRMLWAFPILAASIWGCYLAGVHPAIGLLVGFGVCYGLAYLMKWIRRGRM